jgi:uncharacterized sulfatase
VLDKITDSLYAHTEGKTIGNVGLIATEVGNFVIDTSMFPSMARDIRIQVEKIKTGKLSAAIWTHYHGDHSLGSQAFREAPIYAHESAAHNFTTQYTNENLKEILANQPEERRQLMGGLEITPPTKTFDVSPYMLDENNSIILYQVGGHTDGSTLIHYKEENAIFAGDDLFANIYPWGGDPTASPYDWVNAMDKILEINPKLIIPGHGGVLYNLKEVEYFKSYFLKVIESSKSMVMDNTDEDTAYDELSNIDFYDPGDMVQRKEGTLRHCYKIVKLRNQSGQ